MPPNALLLHVHRPWFDAIAHGYKKYEYRRVTPYWTTRIEGKTYDKLVFQNGYGARFPTMDVEYLGYDIHMNEAGEPYYRLKLGAISNVLNYTVHIDTGGDPAACVDLNRCLDARRPQDCMQFCAARRAWMPRPLPLALEVVPEIQDGTPVTVAPPPGNMIMGGGEKEDNTAGPAKTTVVGDVTLLI